MKTSKHFTIKELVSKETYSQYGNRAWELFDPRAIDTLDFIRDLFGVPVTVNNWVWGGQFQNRGYRDENCKIGADKSPHKRGMAFDFDVKGHTAQQVRDVLWQNSDKLPYPIRCESDVNWVHIDVKAVKGEKIHFFKP